MNCLVDTHVFIWAILSSNKVSKKVKGILLDPENTKFVSVISLWEISLKYSLGKIDLAGITPDKLPDKAREVGFEMLNLKPNVASTFYKLSRMANKDPFDLMLSWQAISEELVLLTADKEFSEHHINGLKAIW